MEFNNHTYLSSDGLRFHAASYGTSEYLEFDSENGNLLARRKRQPGQLLASDPNGTWRAYQKSDTEVIIEPARFDQNSVTITVPGRSDVWRGDRSGERIALAFDQKVHIWSVAQGQLLTPLVHSSKVLAFEWSSDGRHVATISEDRVIRVWDLNTNQIGTQYKSFPYELGFYLDGNSFPRLAWTQDGRSLWIMFGRHAGLLDLQTGRVGSIGSFFNGYGPVSLTLAPDDERLLVVDGYRWTFLRNRDGKSELLGQELGFRPYWHPDSRRFVGRGRGYDVAMHRRLGTLLPLITGNHWLCIGPTGHYRGSAGVEEHIVYVAQLDDGSNITLPPAEFAKRFGWKNDPDKATLLKLDGEK